MRRRTVAAVRTAHEGSVSLIDLPAPIVKKRLVDAHLFSA
jgi:hypothetical protein